MEPDFFNRGTFFYKMPNIPWVVAQAKLLMKFLTFWFLNFKVIHKQLAQVSISSNVRRKNGPPMHLECFYEKIQIIYQPVALVQNRFRRLKFLQDFFLIICHNFFTVSIDSKKKSFFRSTLMFTLKMDFTDKKKILVDLKLFCDGS